MNDGNAGERGDRAAREGSPPPVGLGRLSSEDVRGLSHEEACSLIEELQRHQAELESANEGLREAQLELERSRGRYRDLYGRAPVCYLTLDGSRQILEANQLAAQALGADRSELIGSRFSLFVCDDEPGEPDPLRCGLESGGCPRDLRMRRADGAEFLVAVECTHLHEHQEDAQVLLAFRDVSRERQLECELLELNDELERRVEAGTEVTRVRTEQLALSRTMLEDRQTLIQALLDSAVDAIITIDEQGNVETMNAAAERMFGHAATHVIGQNVGLLMPTPYREGHTSFVERYCRTGEAHIIGNRQEVEGQRKDGTVFPLELSVNELVDGRRTFLGILRDLSEQREMEEELLRSQKMEAIGRLASGLAHNFNNLLAGVAGCCNIILGQLGRASPSRPYAEEMAAALETGSQITRELLAMGTVAGTQRVTLDLNELVLHSEPILRSLIDQSISLTVIPASAPAPLLTIPGRIEQVLMNLVANARDAMPEGGALTISVCEAVLSPMSSPSILGLRDAAADARFVSLEVADTGCGMDEETRRKAFEPFFTTKAADSGSGLGLSTVYGIVRQLHGHIRLDAQPGAGATFTLLFPQAAAPELLPDVAGESAAAAGRGETVLLVEDDRLVRMTTRMLLEAAGFLVLEASRPSEAIELAQESGRVIDVLVTDCILPEMDGSELVANVSQAQPQARILYMSAYPARVLVSQGRLEPGMAFIEKPFKNAELVARIRSLLDRQTT